MLIYIISLLFFINIPFYTFAQDKPIIQIETGITYSQVNVYYPNIDLDFSVPFFNKGINSLAFKGTLLTMIPVSINYPVNPPYVLFGFLAELQYRINTKNGFYFALETGLGVGGEFKQVEVFTIEKGFHWDYSGTPYGLFSLGTRIGYNFKNKFNSPWVLAGTFGYRMQFPYNFYIKHMILYGISLSYAFDLGGKK